MDAKAFSEGQANGAALPYRTLGHTGEKVSCIGLGGFHLGKPAMSESDALKLIHASIDRGINFLDNSWDYNEGESEKRMGKAVKAANLRSRVFMMTKNDGRTAEEFDKQLEQSLKRLQVDHIDLLQFHEIIRFDDADRIFSEGGAAEAALAAKKAGKIRYIGFTGHKDPHVHLYMLEVADRHKFVFDTVQMPINVMDAHYRSFEKLVLPELVKRNIGVLGMKSMGDTTILKSGIVTALECLQYSLSRPVSVQITGIDKPAYLIRLSKLPARIARFRKPRPRRCLPEPRRKPWAVNGNYSKAAQCSTARLSIPNGWARLVRMRKP